jgi:hypothetical protein
VPDDVSISSNEPPQIAVRNQPRIFYAANARYHNGEPGRLENEIVSSSSGVLSDIDDRDIFSKFQGHVDAEEENECAPQISSCTLEASSVAGTRKLPSLLSPRKNGLLIITSTAKSAIGLDMQHD